MRSTPMLARVVFAGMVVLATSGCTRVVQVERPVPAEVRQTVESRSVASDARVLTTGGPFVTRALRFEGERLTSREPSGEAHEFEVGDVRSVQFKSRSEGFVEGLAWGAAVAAGLGLLAAADSDSDQRFLFESRAGIGLFVGVVSALLTVPAGGIIGALRGKTTDFVFDPR